MLRRRWHRHAARLRLGYRHVVAADGQILTGLDDGSFDKQGIDFDLVEFNTGLEVVQAMAAGKLEVPSAGAVISSLLPLGGYTAFLINAVEIATAQLWARPDRGARTSFADLHGRRVATTIKTTAHIFLDRARRANGLAPSDVEIVNSSMPAAVKAFIAGEVPAVAPWVPFHVTMRQKVPDAIKLADASAFYPQSAVVGGWVARHDYFFANRDVFARIIRGWADANDYMIRNSKAAGEVLKKHYPRATPADIAEALKVQKMFSSREWRRLYTDGTVTKWLQQISDFFTTDAGVANPKPVTEYFDSSLYLTTI
ncbi:ABC transporter substrate-binding protein [Bradyrhizobium erythrophlei]|uniref:ABC transporter substrate-binding protein n=1 Tax=Bradyrhizobium erythrophlei TaxID=1437360 RepID=UPI0035E7A718